jgi:hypothetical protein
MPFRVIHLLIAAAAVLAVATTTVVASSVPATASVSIRVVRTTELQLATTTTQHDATLWTASFGAGMGYGSYTSNTGGYVGVPLVERKQMTVQNGDLVWPAPTTTSQGKAVKRVTVRIDALQAYARTANGGAMVHDDAKGVLSMNVKLAKMVRRKRFSPVCSTSTTTSLRSCGKLATARRESSRCP